MIKSFARAYKPLQFNTREQEQRLEDTLAEASNHYHKQGVISDPGWWDYME